MGNESLIMSPHTYHYSNCANAYIAPLSIEEQISILQIIFPNLNTKVNSHPRYSNLPQFAEGWFAVPKWESIARTYAEAVARIYEVMNKMEGKFSFTAKILPNLRCFPHSQQLLSQFYLHQSTSDLIVLPAQFGLQYAGMSAYNARDAMVEYEFGLGAFVIGAMLLTHSNRITLSDLKVVCAGDECGEFGLLEEYACIPIVVRKNSDVKLLTASCVDAEWNYSTPSAFLI
tara:strand:+ start:280 stop:969 length:690 start_codon:yes stop_codon:yes gene_type:complete